MIIRKMELKDYDSVSRIVSQVHNFHSENRPDIYTNNATSFGKEYFESLCNDINSILLAAENDNEIVGVCIVTIKETIENPVHVARKFLSIENICIDEKHRGKGIGKQLYNAVVAKAKELKANSIELTVFSFNKNAISFYENLGMTIKNIKYEQKL